MNNRWNYFSTKKTLIIIAIPILFIILINIFDSYIASIISINTMVIVILLFVSIMGVAFLLKGLQGLFNQKGTSISGRLSQEYQLKGNKIGTRYKEYHGFHSLLNSIISIIIGIFFLLTAIIMTLPLMP